MPPHENLAVISDVLKNAVVGQVPYKQVEQLLGHRAYAFYHGRISTDGRISLYEEIPVDAGAIG